MKETCLVRPNGHKNTATIQDIAATFDLDYPKRSHNYGLCSIQVVTIITTSQDIFVLFLFNQT